MKKGKALLGVLAGLAAGAVIGVIFAPDKDSEARKNMARMGKDLADALSKSMDAKFEEFTARMNGRTKFKPEDDLLSRRRSEAEA